VSSKYFKYRCRDIVSSLSLMHHFRISGRHFAGSQDLVIFSLGSVLFSRRECRSGGTAMKLWLKSVELIDCLQPSNSQFRIAASSKWRVACTQSPVSDVNRSFARKMDSKTFCSRSSDLFFFEKSEDFLARIEGASRECFFHLWSNEQTSPIPGLIEVDYKLSEDLHQQYDVRIGHLVVQWNPSTIIAVQRFLGRLRKESNLISVQFNEIIGRNDQIQSSEVFGDMNGEGASAVTAHFHVESLKVCLNKEHQNRRLLEVTLSDCNATLHESAGGISITSDIGDLLALDTDRRKFDTFDNKFGSDDVRKVLSVLSDAKGDMKILFLHIEYRSFTKRTASDRRVDVPRWARAQVSSPEEIDDFLSVTLSTTRFIYLKERTEEIMDYLSNGLPGKGMGATSRAAKGFIRSRIQTKSFLQVQVISPQIYVPQHEHENKGVSLQLGDVTVRSWFEETSPDGEKTGDLELWRILSLKLSGFSSGITRAGPNFVSLSSASDPIDLDVVLRKPTVSRRATTVRGKLSCFETCLSYSDYALLRAILRDNVGLPVDREKWDNVEKAFWMESRECTLENVEKKEQRVDGGLQKVHYSTSARFVRYGTGSKKSLEAVAGSQDANVGRIPDSFAEKTLDLRFDLAGLSIKLRRDDDIDGMSPVDDFALAFHYNVILLRVEIVEVLTTLNSNGDMSFNLSLFRLGLFDLGDEGRLKREQYYCSLADQELGRLGMKRQNTRKPCPFQVLVEGYDASTVDVSSTTSSMKMGPQFVVSIDTCPASSNTGFGSLSESSPPPDSKVTVARIVINRLSVNALVRPFQEVVDFLTVQWGSSAKDPGKVLNHVKKADRRVSADAGEVTPSGRGFELKLVAHYPRVFFLADESDAHSRALVLQG
jgi:hypothetical protein